MEYYVCLDFCTYFPISLYSHILKSLFISLLFAEKRMKIYQVRAE